VKKNQASENKTLTKKSDLTRSKILSSAEKLFIQCGYDGVSVRDVARDVGITKGLIYYYFRNKRDLFDAVLDVYFRAQTEALMTAVGAGDSLNEKAHAGMDAYLDFVEKNPGYPRLIQREVCSSPRNLDRITKYIEPLYRWGTAVFGAFLNEEGPLSARQFFISFYGLVINYYTYSPVLEGLWQRDLMDQEALAERREHVHLMLDAMIEKYIGGKF